MRALAAAKLSEWMGFNASVSFTWRARGARLSACPPLLARAREFLLDHALASVLPRPAAVEVALGRGLGQASRLRSVHSERIHVATLLLRGAGDGRHVRSASAPRVGEVPRLSNVPASFCSLLGQIKGHAQLIRT